MRFGISCAAAALLVTNAVQLAIADDAGVCRQGTGDEAIAACSRTLALNPKDAVAYNNRGSVYNEKGDYDSAISDLNQAIELDPKLALAYSNRGWAYEGKGDYDRAISDLNQAIELDPKNARPYNNRGEAYEARNDPDHAIADFEQALKLNPAEDDARRGRERVQALLAKRSNIGPQTNAPPR
jgi:tetratricopeptide (TPR) repeat protein